MNKVRRQIRRDRIQRAVGRLFVRQPWERRSGELPKTAYSAMHESAAEAKRQRRAERNRDLEVSGAFGVHGKVV